MARKARRRPSWSRNRGNHLRKRLGISEHEWSAHLPLMLSIRRIEDQLFAAELQKTLQGLAARQITLGPEFEKAWADNIEELYEP